MPVIGFVILPLGAIAVGMSAACCGDRCGFKHLLADGAFLMLGAVGGFGSCRVNDPLAGAVSRNIGLVAALALVPVIGFVILPIRAVAVGMAGRRILIGGLNLHIITGHGEGGSCLGGVCQSDIALRHDPLIKDLAALRCVRRNGHNGVLLDLVDDGGACGNGCRALDNRERIRLYGGFDELCLDRYIVCGHGEGGGGAGLVNQRYAACLNDPLDEVCSGRSLCRNGDLNALHGAGDGCACGNGCRAAGDGNGVITQGGDLGILAALGAANGAFLVLDAGGLLGRGVVYHPLEAVCCRIGLVAALALMPVIGVVILPIRAIAVGMAGRRILIGGLNLHSTCGHGESGSCLGGVCQGDITLQHDPLVKDLVGLRCVRRNGHNGALGDLVGDGGAGGNKGRALDNRDSVLGRSGILYESCLAAAGAPAGVENSIALALCCRFAAVPIMAELIDNMTVAENLSAASCTLIVAAIACGGASGLNLIDQLVVAGNFVEGRCRAALLSNSVARCAVPVAGIALLGAGRRFYIAQLKGTAVPELAGLALYGAAASRAAVVALIGAVPAVARSGVIAFAAMARVRGSRVVRAVVVQGLQRTGMTGVCRRVDIRTGTYDIAAVCAGGVAGVALAVADLRLRIEHRGAAAVVTACIDRLEEELAAAGCAHGAERRDRAAPLERGAVGHQLEQALRLVGIPFFINRCHAVRHVVFAEILHLPADGLLTVSLLGIKLDLVTGLDDHTGCPAVFHRHNGGVLCPIAVNFFRLFVFADAAFSLHAAFAALGVRAQNHIPVAPAVGNHDELLAAGNLALFGVGIAGLKDELLHRLGRAADVEGIFIDAAEAGVIPVPAVIMDMALHIKGIVADGAVEHIDLAAAHCVIASVKRKFMRDDALLGAGGHIMCFVRACFEQARELVALAFANAAHGTVMGIPMLIDPSDLVCRHFFAVVRVNDLACLIIAVGMGGSQLCLRRFHGVRRVTLSADDAVVGVVLLTGLGGNRHLQCGGRHTHVKPILRQLVGRRRGMLIILPIPLIGQLVALQASCRDGEGDLVIFIEQQAVFRLFLIIVVDRGLALDALGLAGNDDGAAADVAADLAHALGVIFMVGGIQLFTVAIAAGMPVLRSVG